MVQHIMKVNTYFISNIVCQIDKICTESDTLKMTICHDDLSCSKLHRYKINETLLICFVGIVEVYRR